MNKSVVPLLSKASSCVFVAVVLAAMIPQLEAQTLQGDFTGVVRDATAAVVPNADVSIINEASNATRTVKTNEQGRYQARGFYVGTYRIEAQAQGFSRSVAKGIELRPAANTPVDFILEIATAGQSITVESSAGVIQSEGGTLNYDLDQSAYGKYQMMGANAYSQPFAGLQWTAAYTTGRSFMEFRGAKPGFTSYTYDGSSGKGIRVRIPDLATRSEELVSFGAPAEYRRAVTANVTFKSGTNDLHGEYRATFSNPVLNAVKTPFYRGDNDLGISTWIHDYAVGGPVVLPKYDGRNKTFFYHTLEYNRGNQKYETRVDSIPTAGMLTGDYSGQVTTITDPLSGLPFPNQVIPSTRISSAARLALTEYYSKYTYQGAANSTNSNGRYTSVDQSPAKTAMFKIDHNFANGDALNAYYQFSKVNGRALDPYYWTSDAHWQLYSFRHTHIFRPNIVNQFHFGGSRNTDAQNETAPDWVEESGAEVAARLGLQGVTPPEDWQGRPRISVSNWQSLWNSGGGSKTIHSFFNVDENISIMSGKHDFKVGVAGRLVEQDAASNGNFSGSYTFNGRYSGESLADLLLGYPSSTSRAFPRVWVAGRRKEVGLFAQDTFRITPSFQMSYGLRWDYYTAPTDRNGLYYNFDLPTGTIVVPDQHALNSISGAWTSTVPVRLASEVGYPEKLLSGHGHWSPRFSFSYRPASDWVIRGAYGVYVGEMSTTELQTGGPFQVTEKYSNWLENGIPALSLLNGFPNSQSSSGISTATTVSQDYRSGNVQNWNLTVEKSILKDWGARLSYIGTKSTNLPYVYDANTPLTLSTSEYTASRRPYSDFSYITAYANGANANYQGFEASIRHPFGKGFYVQAALSLNRDMSEVGHTSTWSPESQTAFWIDYAYDRARDMGETLAWTRGAFHLNWVYELPVGRSRKFGSSAAPVMNAIFGDWAVSGVYLWRSGMHFTPTYSGYDTAGLDQWEGRVNVVAGCDPYAGGKQLGAGATWFNPACFSIPEPGTLGNAEVGSLVGPGAWTVSLNPYKTVSITERLSLQIGARITNLFNHPVYANPVADITSANAGQISSGIEILRAGSGVGMRKATFVASLSF